MRLILTTLILVGVLSLLFAVACAMHEPRRTVTKDQISIRIYGWPHEWLAVSEHGNKQILMRRFAYSFGLVVVLPAAILATMSVFLLKPRRKT